MSERDFDCCKATINSELIVEQQSLDNLVSKITPENRHDVGGMEMFEFDKSKVPELIKMNTWKLEDGTDNTLYEAKGSLWTFEYPGEEDIQAVEDAVYAWIAWLNWLRES